MRLGRYRGLNSDIIWLYDKINKISIIFIANFANLTIFTRKTLVTNTNATIKLIIYTNFYHKTHGHHNLFYNQTFFHIIKIV